MRVTVLGLEEPMKALQTVHPQQEVQSEQRSKRRGLVCSLLGTGAAYPDRVLSNRYFVETLRLDTSESWIEEKTGIIERRHVEDESLTDLCIQAASEALEQAGLTGELIDLIIVATSTADNSMPSTACLVQRAIGASRASAFDLNAACSGFVHALEAASRWIAADAQNALVIGADLGSRLADQRDRLTAVFFGDAAGAAVLSSQGTGRILSSLLRSDGNDEALIAKTGGKLKMDGRQVWNFATRVLPETVRELASRAGVSVEEIELVIPHQANINIIAAAAEELNLSMDRMMVNLDRFGNTVAASIPMALDEAVRNGRLLKGDLVALVGYGAGLAWGGQLWEL